MSKVYRDPVINKLIQVLNENGPRELKNKYFFGDPVQVPASALPACFITKDRTQITPADTATDDHRMSVVINAVFDMRKDWQKTLDQVLSYDTLSDILEGRGEDYQLKTTSLAYVLKHFDQLDSNMWIDLDTATEIDYGIGVEKRGKGIFTVEGVIRTTIRLHKLRP